MTEAEKEVSTQLTDWLSGELSPSILSLSFVASKAVDIMDSFDKSLESPASVEEYVVILMEVRKTQKVIKSLSSKLASLVDSAVAIKTQALLPFPDPCDTGSEDGLGYGQEQESDYPER